MNETCDGMAAIIFTVVFATIGLIVFICGFLKCLNKILKDSIYELLDLRDISYEEPFYGATINVKPAKLKDLKNLEEKITDIEDQITTLRLIAAANAKESEK